MSSSVLAFNDNFDRTDSATVGNDWDEIETGNSYAEIASNVLHIYDEDVDEACVAHNISLGHPTNNLINYSFKIDTITADHDVSQMRFYNTSEYESTKVHTINVQTDENLLKTWNYTVKTTVGNIAGATWYDITISNISLQDQTFNLYLDDVLVAEEFAFNTNVTTIDVVEFCSFASALASPTNNLYLDHFTSDEGIVALSGLDEWDSSFVQSFSATYETVPEWDSFEEDNGTWVAGVTQCTSDINSTWSTHGSNSWRGYCNMNSAGHKIATATINTSEVDGFYMDYYFNYTAGGSDEEVWFFLNSTLLGSVITNAGVYEDQYFDVSSFGDGELDLEIWMGDYDWSFGIYTGEGEFYFDNVRQVNGTITESTTTGVLSTGEEIIILYNMSADGYQDVIINEYSQYQSYSASFERYPFLYQCTSPGAGAVALNFTLKEEETDTSLLGEIEGYFEYVQSYSGATQNLTVNVTNESSLSVCTFQSDESYLTDAQLQYGADGYDDKLYYLDGFNISDTLTTVPLYLTNGTTQVNFQTVDYNDDPIEGVIIKVMSYDLPTDSYTITEVLQSDSSGDAYGQIILNTEWYAFILEYDSEIVLETSPSIITSTTKKFRVSLDTDYFENYDYAEDIAHTLVFTNSTKTFTFTYNDPNLKLTTACLEVRRDGISGTTVLDTNCVSSFSGIINVVVPSVDQNDAYSATSYVTFNGDPSRFVLNTMSVDFRTLHETFGTSGLFVGFLLIVFASMAFLWSPIAAVIAVDFFVIVLRVIGWFELSMPALFGLLILSAIAIGVMVKQR